MLYEISVTSLGGKLNYGFVENSDEINLFNEYIKWNKDIRLKNELIDNLDDDESKYVEYQKYNNLLDIGGISSSYLGINKKKIKVSSIEDNNKKEIFYQEDSFCYNNIILNTPYIYKEDDDDETILLSNSGCGLGKVLSLSSKNKNTLMFSGLYLKNDLEVKIQLNLEDNEEFDINNLFFGCIDLTDLLYRGDFVSKYYYINKETQIKLYKLIHSYFFTFTNNNDDPDDINFADDEYKDFYKDDSVDLIDETLINQDAVAENVTSFLSDLERDVYHDSNVLNIEIVKEINKILENGECKIIDYIESKNDFFNFEKAIIKDMNENKLYERDYDIY